MNKIVAPAAVSGAVNVREIVTPRGVTAWLVEDYAVPLVSLEFAFRGGAAQDPAGKARRGDDAGRPARRGRRRSRQPGVSSARSTRRRSRFRSMPTRDHIGGRMRTLVRHVDRAAALLRLALNAPRFDEEPFERVREQMNARLRHEANDPGTMASRAWRARVFPGHPYGTAAEGSVETLPAIAERRTSNALARKLVARGALHIGHRRRDRCGARGEADRRVFADLPAKRGSRPGRPRRRSPASGRGVVDLDVPQSTIRFGRPGSGAPRPRLHASIVLAHILGGGTGLSSRLFREVREKRGLAYSASPGSPPTIMRAICRAARRPRTSARTKSLEVIRGEILDMAQNGASARRSSTRARNI